MWYTVYVEDNVTGQTVVVGDLLSRADASKLSRTIGEFMVCKVYVVNCEFQKGLHEK